MDDTLVQESDIERVPLKQYFGITDAYDTGYGEDLDFITGWAKEKGLSKEDLFVELKKIERRLGSPMPGENRWRRIKTYLSLDQKITNALKEMFAYERGDEK
jgi:hypothetical protein